MKLLLKTISAAGSGLDWISAVFSSRPFPGVWVVSEIQANTVVVLKHSTLYLISDPESPPHPPPPDVPKT